MGKYWVCKFGKYERKRYVPSVNCSVDADEEVRV